MKEIKFRAWDKKKKTMIGHDKLFRLDCSNEYPFLALLENHYKNSINPLDVEVMQYTGLKDKNGKEIYEGDIVRHTVDYGPGGEGEHISKVVITPFGVNMQAWIFTEEGYLPEIIGNIYEQGELISCQSE